MLDYYFKAAWRRRQLCRGPLAKHLDDLAAALRRESYAPLTARRILSIAGQFSHYAALAGIRVDAVDDACVATFLADRLVPEGLFRDGRRAMRYVLRYLRAQGIVAPVVARIQAHPDQATLDAYEEYLDGVRGLALSTRRKHRTSAQQFMAWIRQRSGGRRWRPSAPDVVAYIGDTLEQRTSRSARGHLCSDIRTFLRYLHASGRLARDLTGAVPHVAHPRLATIPTRLPWAQVRALIDSVDTTWPEGKRDKAILLLLATVGLRSQEVRTVALRDIHWRSGEIRIRRTKTRRERTVPLLAETGAAIVDYLLHGRPPLDIPQVFLRHLAPPGPITTANTIVWIVRRQLRRAGIVVAGGGAHMLRHSLATRMVNAGVPVKAVADVLGHASIDTTAIYTKVDLTTLATVPLPFPGGAR
jgi:integrase/recombinase XerD